MWRDLELRDRKRASGNRLELHVLFFHSAGATAQEQRLWDVCHSETSIPPCHRLTLSKYRGIGGNRSKSPCRTPAATFQQLSTLLGPSTPSRVSAPTAHQTTLAASFDVLQSPDETVFSTLVQSILNSVVRGNHGVLFGPTDTMFEFAHLVMVILKALGLFKNVKVN